MEKRNWSSWLPPRTLPNTGDKDFKAGQVWASRCSESGSVRRIIDNSSGNHCRYETLAGSGSGFMTGDSNAAWCAVLVQDVGQEEPTSPRRLYGEVVQEDECTPTERDWSRWIPPEALLRRSTPTWVKGQVWACRTGSGHMGVFRVIDPKGDKHENLAGEGEYFSAKDSGRCSVLVQDVDQENPTPPSVLYGETKETNMPEMKVTTGETDWRPWTTLPTQAVMRDEIPDRKVGQVWANYSRVVRVLTAAEGDKECDQEILASVSACSFLVPRSFQRAYLVQDVGQEEPVPPEVLRKQRNGKEITMGAGIAFADDNEINWQEHIPAKDECKGGDRIEEADIKKGQVYAYQYSLDSRGVVRVTENGNSITCKLLAHTREKTQSPWSISGRLQDGYIKLIADKDGWVPGYAKAPQMHKRPAPIAKPKGKREVSIDGLQYIDYDKMTDSDSFESYPYYRIRKPDGTFSVDERPVMELQMEPQLFCRMSGCINPGPFGREGECMPCHVKEESIIAQKTATMQRGRGASVTRVRDYAPRQSHSMFWGGVFSLRE